MGVPPLIGRAIAPSDGAAEAPAVAVLGYKFWQRQFGGDPSVLGREFRWNDKMRTVVGVMPPRFMWRGADVYLPVAFQRGRVVEGVENVHLLGRLKRGVTEAQAEADLRPIMDELKRREPRAFPDKFRVGLLSFKETFPSGIRDALWILLGAVGLLLLIACANVSNLLLSKAIGRQREMAVRASLGAGRGRLIRQLLTESVVLAVAAGTLGVGLAAVAVRAILILVPPNTIPDEAQVSMNTPVLMFALGISVLTALVFGLAPALHVSRPDLADTLRQAGRGAGSGMRQALLRNGLVVIEVALSIMLLAGAGLIIRTLLAMQAVDIGINADRILTMRVPLADQRYPDPARRIAFWNELLQRVNTVPGVAAVGLNTGMHPFGNMGAPVEVPGSPQQDNRPAVIHQVNRDYTNAMGIALLRGRTFSESEVAAKQHVALVNEAFVRTYLGAADPLGRTLRVPRLRRAPFSLTDDSLQIVGVVRDALNRGVRNEIAPEVYVPFTLAGVANYLLVRTRMDPAAVTNSVRGQVYAIDKNQPVTDVRTMETLIGEWMFSQPRFNLVLFSIFAVLGLALAVVGVYGVISNSVSQQTQEIGVRIALGAGFGNIAGMVMRRGMKLLLAGIGVGLVGSFAAARVMAQQIWRVPAFDVPSLAIVSGLLLGVGLWACFWPARRAARVDPMVALRWE
jgi:predicted permease